MKNKFKKFLIALFMLGGVFALGSCASAKHDATIPTNECAVKVIEDAVTKEKTAVITLGLLNNTIYNVEKESITYTTYKGNEVVNENITEEIELFIRHGVAGYITYTYKVPQGVDIDSVKITHSEVTKYSSLFDTYLVPFVAMFSLAGLAIIIFSVDLFRGGLTKESAKNLFKEKLASSLTIMALVLIICLIPLMFSSWVVTLILAGGFIGTGLVCGLLTLLRMAFIKDK